MTTLTTAERDALPDTAFGLPDRRSYPMPDAGHAGHAGHAKARAAEEFNRGNLTAAEKQQIDLMADELLGAA